MKQGTRVLMVEDDRYISELVAMELEHRGIEVLCASDGSSGLEAARRFRPDVIVLDVMLPGLDGVGVLKRLRAGGSRVPVVMLTARDAPTDKVHSLDLGADDYLTKPFHVEELLARMRAVMRRTEGEEIVRVADLTIDRTMEVVRGEREIRLTAREYIAELARAQGRPLRFHPRRTSGIQAFELGKWLIKRLAGRWDARLPSYRQLRSQSMQARFDCEDVQRDLGWRPVADRAEFVRRAIEVHARPTESGG